ncbi:MAG: ZIP family metal transporter [Bacilli bacterium]|nr:ZIP family metal transporter [Bacilli bacterium]
MIILLGILIPFIGTTLGSSMVFFLKKHINEKLEKLLIGFAAGVMIAASIWSLLIPSLEKSEFMGTFSFLPAAIGFLLGMFFMMIIDSITNKMEKKKDMLNFAVTLHNVPEGMAVGVVFASVISSNDPILLAGALALSIGIAIQNFPEGAIISMPLKAKGKSKIKAFKAGVLSGLVEPLSSFITILLTNFVVPILPYLLSFAAGSMIYVVASELIPEYGGKTTYKNIGIAIGFTLMMILDVVLG